jgi:hypothetical protein
MTKICREHHFNSSGRCSYCQMQARYYEEALSALNGCWTEKEKKDPSEHWQEKVDSYKCVPHSHEEENPLEGLYDLEVGQ